MGHGLAAQRHQLARPLLVVLPPRLPAVDRDARQHPLDQRPGKVTGRRREQGDRQERGIRLIRVRSEEPDAQQKVGILLDREVLPRQEGTERVMEKVHVLGNRFPQHPAPQDQGFQHDGRVAWRAARNPLQPRRHDCPGRLE